MLDISRVEELKKNFFQGSLDYTKNQPDFFLLHKYKPVSPSTARNFLNDFKKSIDKEKRVLIYIHLPFCFSECVFCNSFPHKVNKEQQNIYFKSVLKEIELYDESGLFKDKTVQSIYFGGGTPTSFSNDNLKVIIDKIRNISDVLEDASITTEAHPLTLKNPDRIEGLHNIGINRVSMGCQTFDQKILKICNRAHTIEGINKIIEKLNELKMLSNIDMMAGLPGQTVQSMKNDMKILEQIKPTAVEYIRHEIVNPLAIEIYRKEPELIVKDDDLFEMVFLMQSWMQKQGYEQNGYFTSRKFWEYRYHWLKELPIIAFGSRARSYSKTMSFDKHENISLYTKLLDKGIPPIGRSTFLSRSDQMFRYLFLNLQFKRGLLLEKFQERFNENAMDVFKELIQSLSEFNCIMKKDNRLFLTEAGAFFVEDVCDFIIDFALKKESSNLKRNPNSTGSTSARL